MLLGAAAILLAALPAGAFTGHDATASLELPLAFDAYQAAAATRPFEPAGNARTAALGAGWRFQKDPRTGWVRMARGGSVALAEAVRGESHAAALARTHLLANADLLGVREDNAELRSVRQAGGKWAVHYRQVLHGVPVWKGSAFALIHEDGRLAAFGSEFRPEPDDFPAHPRLSAADALSEAARSIGAVPRADRPQVAEPYWVPAPNGELMELALAWRVVFESEDPFGKWETFVHGTSGEILGRRNLYFPVDVVGNTEGSTAANPPTYGWCDGFSTFPYEHMTVSVSGGNSAPSLPDGEFVVPHGGAIPVNVTAQFSGPYSNVNRFSGLGADASQTILATPGNHFTFTWDNANSREDERTTFYHANVVHDFMKAIDATFTQLDYAMPSVVGRTDGFCPGNAWWDGTGMNYCAQGGSGTTYYNTGLLGNVIYHEFGHGVTQEVYERNAAPEPPGGLHEGNSDVLANFIDRNSYIGLGFSSSTGCSNGIRNAVNGLTYPTYNENGGHTAGQVIAGFHWLAWQSMLGAMPQAEADAIAFSTWHFARDLGTPQTFPDQVEWTFLVDDDDATFDNGTPNYDHLCPAAEAKGFVCPEILVGVYIVHTPLPPTTLDGSLGFDVVATIASTEAVLDPAALKTHYRLNGGAFTELFMTATGNPNEYFAHIPALPQGTEAEYYISAADVEGNTKTSPLGAPAQVYAFDVLNFHDTLESGVAGWTIGLPGDDAASGLWGLFDPVGTAAQPEDDSTPDPGTMCFITGQCGPGHGSCGGGCTLGCNDIDGGTTTLVSPVWDLTGAVSAKVKYDRWFSNDTGAEPGQDFWVVQVSNDAGGSWTTVENTNASLASWTSVGVDIDALFGTPGQVQLRFVASDLNPGSLVEAAVDEVRVLADYGAVDAPAVAEGAAAPERLALDPGQPNPFAGSTRIAFAVPRPGHVTLAVYDVSGRVVRTVTSGRREAGRHHAQWDGRTAEGNRVTAGVYFLRLTADGQSLTRKVTMMK
jgi:hypothetical protein